MNNKPKTYTIAFYNIENLFDIKNKFIPFSEKSWTLKRYQNKLLRLGSAISQIGKEESRNAPAIVGLAEVENQNVLSDLVNSENLIMENYSYIHYDSLDKRGISVALLYKSDVFKVEHSKTFSVPLQNELGEQDYTRDILWVQGQLEHEPVHIIVNHWSSRREGTNETEYKRIAAANVVNSVITRVKKENSDAKIIVMGDFNDNPNCRSLLMLENAGELNNPFKTIWSRKTGSLNHNFKWHLFDQILLSQSLMETQNATLWFNNAQIYNKEFLMQRYGKTKGHPFSTYIGNKHIGGYSDHFPVYIQLNTS